MHEKSFEIVENQSLFLPKMGFLFYYKRTDLKTWIKFGSEIAVGVSYNMVFTVFL